MYKLTWGASQMRTLATSLLLWSALSCHLVAQGLCVPGLPCPQTESWSGPALGLQLQVTPGGSDYASPLYSRPPLYCGPGDFWSEATSASLAFGRPIIQLRDRALTPRLNWVPNCSTGTQQFFPTPPIYNFQQLQQSPTEAPRRFPGILRRRVGEPRNDGGRT